MSPFVNHEVNYASPADISRRRERLRYSPEYTTSSSSTVLVVGDEVVVRPCRQTGVAIAIAMLMIQRHTVAASLASSWRV